MGVQRLCHPGRNGANYLQINELKHWGEAGEKGVECRILKHSCACPRGSLKGVHLFKQLLINGLYKPRGGREGHVSRYATPVSLCDTKGHGRKWARAVESAGRARIRSPPTGRKIRGEQRQPGQGGRCRTRPKGGPRNPAAPPQRTREGLRRVLDPVLPAAASPYRKEEVRGVRRGRRGHRDGAPPRLPARSRAGAGRLFRDHTGSTA